MIRRVMVTGATTPLGLQLVAELAADPDVHAVLALGVEDEPPPLPQGVRYERTDLARARHVRRLLSGPVRELEIDTIVHTALHRSATDEGRRIHKLNVESTRLLMRLASAAPGIRRFVYRSDACVYRVRVTAPQVLREDHPLELAPDAPQWVRDRVEGDVVACTWMGLADLRVIVLRCSEILTPGMGSQLLDWLRGRVCVRPLGFDPMLNILSMADACRAVRLAIHSDEQGVLNITGADTLPLSQMAALCGKPCVTLPGPAVGAVYGLRARTNGGQFRYDMNRNRFHFGGVLDGSRAGDVLGYAPHHPISWPPWGLET